MVQPIAQRSLRIDSALSGLRVSRLCCYVFTGLHPVIRDNTASGLAASKERNVLTIYALSELTCETMSGATKWRDTLKMGIAHRKTNQSPEGRNNNGTITRKKLHAHRVQHQIQAAAYTPAR